MQVSSFRLQGEIDDPYKFFMAKITKKKLLEEIDEKLQQLNLLKSALANDQSRKQEDLDNYQKHFYELINKKK